MEVQTNQHDRRYVLIDDDGDLVIPAVRYLKHLDQRGYAHATWKRLAPFFRLPGRVTQGPRAISVELRPFNDRQLNHDLVVLCARVNQASLQLPDGRHLLFSVSAVFDRQQPQQDCTPGRTKES